MQAMVKAARKRYCRGVLPLAYDPFQSDLDPVSVSHQAFLLLNCETLFLTNTNWMATEVKILLF